MDQKMLAENISADKEVLVEIDAKKSRTLLDKITQSFFWKALEESGRRRAEHALKFGGYY